MQLLTAHQICIRSYILSLVPNYNDAEDVMQETSRMMWSKFSEFEPGTDFLTWGRTVAFYRVLDYRQQRKRYRKQQAFNDELLHILDREVKCRKHQSQDYLQFLRDCLEKLSKKDRLLIRMRYERHTKVREIARRIGITVQSVYRNTSRVQEQLQGCVQRTAMREGIR